MIDNFRNRTISGLRWSGISQVGRQLLNFFTSVILARLLSPQEFGLLGMIIVFTGFAQVFSELGLGAALIHKQDLNQSHLNSVFLINLVTGVFLSGIIIACAPFIASFYNEPKLKLLTMVVAINFIIGSFKVVQQSLFQKKLDFRILALIDIIATFIAGFTAIIMALMGCGVWSLVIQSLFLMLISVVMLWRFSSWRPNFSFKVKALKDLLGFSSNLLGFNILNYWVRNLDNLLVGKFIGASSLGIYVRAYSLMLLPISQVTSIISQVMWPALSIIQKNIYRVKDIYLRSTRVIALVTFPMMAALFVVADSFILGIFGIKWKELIPIFRILCIEGFGQGVGTTVGWIYNSQGRTDIQFKWGIFSGIIRFIAFFIGLRWGVMGVAAAYVISGYFILWYPAWAIPGRLINLRFVEMLRNLAGCFFCAVTMAIFIWGLKLGLPCFLPHLLQLGIQLPAGFIVYLTLIRIFKLKAYFEVKQILNNEVSLIISRRRSKSKHLKINNMVSP